MNNSAAKVQNLMVMNTSKLWEQLAAQALTIDVAPVLQVAADGRWEQAQIVPIPSDLEAAHTAVARVAAAAQFLAIEILWPGTMFVGTAWPADRHAEAVQAVTRAFAALSDARRPLALSPAMTGLTALLGETPDGEVESADLGAVNAWLSVGHELLWRRGEHYSGAAVDKTLEHRTDLMTCTHPVAIEFSISGPRSYWVAIFVSTPSDTAHYLNRQRLHDILTAVIEPLGRNGVNR